MRICAYADRSTNTKTNRNEKKGFFSSSYLCEVQQSNGRGTSIQSGGVGGQITTLTHTRSGARQVAIFIYRYDHCVENINIALPV